MVRLNSSPATATITSEQQKQIPAPLSFPIQISYAGGSSGTAIESPAVKIDYSKFTLPATSPSIKIDLSSFSQQVSKPTASSSSGGLDEDYDIWGSTLVAWRCQISFFLLISYLYLKIICFW